MDTHVYDREAEEYIRSWLKADMREQYRLFEKELKSGARILDGGCGSGRDSLYFLMNGYNVDAFDPSEEMRKAASEFTGLDIEDLSWEKLARKNVYDGVWASASLYHVSRPDMASTFKKIAESLKSKGILFCSFRDNVDDFEEGGRFFTSFTKESFLRFLSTLGLFDVVKIQEREDTREDRKNEKWIFCFLRKRL